MLTCVEDLFALPHRLTEAELCRMKVGAVAGVGTVTLLSGALGPCPVSALTPRSSGEAGGLQGCTQLLGAWGAQVPARVGAPASGGGSGREHREQRWAWDSPCRPPEALRAVQVSSWEGAGSEGPQPGTAQGLRE